VVGAFVGTDLVLGGRAWVRPGLAQSDAGEIDDFDRGRDRAEKVLAT
jgi:hypothetical protein